MAKKLSLKQQIYQQIANKQVQEVLNQQNEQRKANLMADFDAWQKQQQDPAKLMEDFNNWKAAQNPQPTQTIPSIADTQPKRDLQAEAKEYFANVRNERRVQEAEEKRLKEQQLKATLNDYARAQQEENMLASMSANKKKELKVGQRPEATDTSAPVAARLNDKSTFRGGEKWDKSVKDTLNMLNSKDVQTLSRLPQIEDTRTIEEKASRWLSPDVKLTEKEKKLAKEYASEELQKFNYGPNNKPLLETPEDRQHYADMVNLINKTNGFTNFMQGALEVPYNLADMISDGARSVGNQLASVGTAVADKLGITEGATKRHNEKVAAANAIADQKEASMRQSFKNAQTQDPGAYTTGKIAGQTGMYMLTNPVFDGIAAGAGIESELAKFFINQGAQNVQDLVLDTAPTVKQLMEDGATPEEVKREALNNILWNAAGNAIMGGAGELLKNRAVKKAAQIPGMEDVDNVVRNATEQAEEATKNLEDIAKQLPEVEEPNLTNPFEGIDKQIIEQAEEVKPVEKAVEETAETAKKQIELPEETQEKLVSDFEEIYRSWDNMYRAAEASGSEKAIEKVNKLKEALFDYESKVWKSEDLNEINKAKKASDAARQAFIREMKKIDPSYKGDLTGTKLGQAIFRRQEVNKIPDDVAQELVDDMIANENPNKWVRDAEPDTKIKYNTPGAEPLQTFGGDTKSQWKTSKARKNTIEKLGWGDQMPEKDFAYRVYSEAEQRADAAARYANSKNVVADLLNKNYEDFDELDVKTAYNEAQRLLDQGDRQSLAQAQMLMKKSATAQRESGRVVQASAEFTRDTAAGALGDAMKMEEDTIINPWKSKNKKAVEGNSRIAKALADMGHKAPKKEVKQLTHDEIKAGVRAEIEREVGSVEKYFNDQDIEFLTELAEDKSIPTWQITSEIEHKLKTGDWFTLDESVPIPQPTNKKLQSAINSLIEKEVRPSEAAVPDLKQITEEVRNTLAKESADFSGQFTDDDIDYIANLINNGATKNEITDALNTKLATGSFGISDETMQQVNAIFKDIANSDPNSKYFVEGQLEAYRLLANEVVGNATPLEKFAAWRYLAMLGNPKTMLRNFIGNKTFGVVTGISNNVAAIAEAGIDKASKALGGEGIQRTKSVLNPVKDRGLIKAAAEDADFSRYRQMIGSKYEKMSKDTLKQSKSVFNSKLAKFYEKVTDAGISDYSAVKKKFSTSLAGYLKANGYDKSIFNAEIELARLKNLSETRLLSDAEKNTIEKLTKEVDALEKGRDFALKQAEYATFHEDNAIANVLSKWSRTSKEEGKGIGHVLIEGMVPFKKTPANVLKSGLEYSPLGAIDSIKKTGKLVYENTGKRAGNLADTYINKKGKEISKTLASDVIDSWSKTLTGTGLTALGYYLYDKGILHSSDPDTKYQDQLEGHQNYAIEINGKSYTIDWAAPTVMPLMVGAEIAKLWDSTGKDTEDFYNNIDGYIEAANRISDPLIETSMLQGVRDTLETASSYASNNEAINILPLLGYNLATGYVSQALPTIGGQIARTIDPTRRSTYTDKEGVAGVLDKQLKKQMNKIPGLSRLNQPYVDTYGREQANSPFGNPLFNLGYQMLSPGYLSNVNETKADELSREAYDVSKNANTLPKWQSKFKDSDGNRVSPEDYTTASKAYGQANYDIRDALANEDWFNNLGGSQKEEIVKSINTVSEHIGNAAIDPEYDKDSKPYQAYKEGGIPSLLDYYKGQAAKSTLKEISGGSVKADSKAGEKALALIEQGKNDEAAEVVSDKNSFDEYGKDNASYAYNRYEATKQKIPELTVEEYKATVNKMDGLNGEKKNGQISQKEMIAYLNKGNYTQAEAERLWKQFGNDWKQNVGQDKNGKWVIKKAK